MTCVVADCARPTRPGHRMCDAHERRASRGQSLSKPIADRLSPWGCVVEAAIALADADTDEAFARAKKRLRWAALSWIKGSRR